MVAFAFGAAALGAVVMAVPFVTVAGAALVGAFVAVAAVVALGLFTAFFDGFFDALGDGAANVVAGGAVLAARGAPLMGAFLRGVFAGFAVFFGTLFPSLAGLFARRGAFLVFT